MGGEPAAPGHVGDLAHLSERPDGAAAEIRRLLDPDETAPRHVAIVRPDGGLEGRRVVLPARAVEGPDVDAGQRGRTAALEVDRMRRLVRQHLFAVSAVHAERDLVAHRARRQEECRLLAEELGHHLLEKVDRGILVLLLVAHFGLAHEAAHVLRGLGDRVAGEIDLYRHRHWFSSRA